MKKILAIGLLFLTVGCKKEETTSEVSNIDTYEFKESNGHTYKVYKYYNGGVHVINKTKDSLETEYYKTQITVNNKYYGHD